MNHWDREGTDMGYQLAGFSSHRGSARCCRIQGFWGLAEFLLSQPSRCEAVVPCPQVQTVTRLSTHPQQLQTCTVLAQLATQMNTGRNQCLYQQT